MEVIPPPQAQLGVLFFSYNYYFTQNTWLTFIFMFIHLYSPVRERWAHSLSQPWWSGSSAMELTWPQLLQLGMTKTSLETVLHTGAVKMDPRFGSHSGLIPATHHHHHPAAQHA
jgi:hypothetical protein